MSDEPGFVAIVGAGQVGTMLGLALRASGTGAGVTEVAVLDREPAVAQACRRMGGADRILASLDEALEADTVVLAVPMPEIVRLLPHLAPRMRPGALLIDTGSTKAPVVDAMRAHVPPPVHALGGHPLAGTERPGPAGARPDLLRDATFVLTPVRDDPRALARGRALGLAVGARPLIVDAETHDRAISRTSHLPHVLAYALALLGAESEQDGTPVRDLVAGGFRGSVRLAASDPAMVAGFLRTNAREVREAANRFRVRFDTLIGALDDTGGDRTGSGDDALVALLGDGQRWIAALDAGARASEPA